MTFVKANNKQELIDEVRHVLRKSMNIKASDDLVNRIVNRRSERIREGIESKCPRILMEGIGSFKIKQGKHKVNGVRKGREYYVRKHNKFTLANIEAKFVTGFKIVSNGDD